jgi:hypothetical protein
LVGSREAVLSWGWGDRVIFGRRPVRRAGGHTPRAPSNCLPPEDTARVHTITSFPARHTLTTHPPRTTAMRERAMYLQRTYPYLLQKHLAYLLPHTHTEKTIKHEKTAVPTLMHTTTRSPYLFRTYPYLLVHGSSSPRRGIPRTFPKPFTTFAPDGSPPGSPLLDHSLRRSHTARPHTGLP